MKWPIACWWIHPHTGLPSNRCRARQPRIADEIRQNVFENERSEIVFKSTPQAISSVGTVGTRTDAEQGISRLGGRSELGHGRADLTGRNGYND